MKKLKALEGIAVLSRTQQKHIFGGDELTHAPPGDGGGICPEDKCSSVTECDPVYSGCYTYQCDDGQTFKQCGY